jgi:hypothetical protein
MRKVLMSLLVIAVAVSVAVVGISGAWFSDIKSAEEDAASPGANELVMGDMSLSPIAPMAKITGLMPCEKQWGYIIVHNDGDVPGNAWLHITNVMNYENTVTHAECLEYWELSRRNPDALRFDNDVERFISFDMYIDTNIDGKASGGRWIIKQDEVKLADIECQWIPLGQFEPCDKWEVWLSFHLQDEAGNQYQTDKVTFDIEVLLQQTAATAPVPTYVPGSPGACQMRVLRLENKSVCSPPAVGECPTLECWAPIIDDGIYGILTYDWYGPELCYTLEAHGLAEGTYKLIYYADPWPGNNPGRLLGTFKTDGSGNIGPSYYCLNLGYDLPHPKDWNYARSGAKIWLVPESDWVGGKNTWANPDDYLFEMRLIKYRDTDA